MKFTVWFPTLLASAAAFAPVHYTTTKTLALQGTLNVYLDRIEHLKDEDGIGNKSDPYVTLELEQDNWVFDKGYGKKKSGWKRNELSPEFDETFEFPDVPDDLENMVLSLKVWDADIGFDDEIGDCKIKLEGMDLSEPQEVDKVIDRRGLGLIRKNAKIYVKVSMTD